MVGDSPRETGDFWEPYGDEVHTPDVGDPDTVKLYNHRDEAIYLRRAIGFRTTRRKTLK